MLNFDTLVDKSEYGNIRHLHKQLIEEIVLRKN